MIYILIFLILSRTTALVEERDIELENFDEDDYILCRHCGSDISSSQYLVSVRSPASHYAFNDTLFNKPSVLVQVLSNGLIIEFPVITTSQSNCITEDEWEVDETWFPGFRWKICVCPACGEYKGWFFEPISPDTSKKPFYALILSTLIGESCKYLLLGLLVLGVSSLGLHNICAVHG